MTALETFFSSGLTLLSFALVIFAAYKIFQIGTDVAEMKQLLKDIRRGVSMPEGRAVTVSSQPTSAEELVRAVHAASYEDLDEIASPRKPL